jgi:hypothetical protein
MCEAFALLLGYLRLNLAISMAAIVPFGQPGIPTEPCYTPLFHHHSLRLYNTKTLELLTSS